MRGENSISTRTVSGSAETSPRAWRKPLVLLRGPVEVRNISTCVEKTASAHGCKNRPWKHLHVRGENTTESGLFTLYMRYIESIHAIFVKEQNNLLVFPLSYQTFDLFLGQQRKQR